MNVEEEAEAPRPRPLSGGLWTLFSWLRRDERSSSESLSSVGSDHTVASFAFLAPPPPRASKNALTPLEPPTNSYRNRVRDRNLRRQHDRDLTLHRKYGLFRGDVGYDAFTLPNACRCLSELTDKADRDRRATSESLQRRTAHVPGKRRAPLPPLRSQSVTPSISFVRRHTRKRPAPPPPVKLIEKTKENIIPPVIDLEKNKNTVTTMDSHSGRNSTLPSNDTAMGCRLEKYSKKDSNSKEIKTRSEKSFLKQIFEHKKRNSAIETVPERLLPSISELDKQAAEIIETFKLKPLEQNNNQSVNGQQETWFCTRCLRKYNCTVVTCLYCLPEQKKIMGVGPQGSSCSQTDKISTTATSTSRVSGVGVDEKEKLKEMLKQMKNSLPKRPKHNVMDKQMESKLNQAVLSTLETPTLRIGTEGINDLNQPSTMNYSIEKEKLTTQTIKPVTENVIITKHVVLMEPKQKDVKTEATTTISLQNSITDLKHDVIPPKKSVNLHTPLKISTLLNPVYIPKNNVTEIQQQKNILFSQEPKSPQEQKVCIKPITKTQNTPTVSVPNSISTLNVSAVQLPSSKESKQSEGKVIEIEHRIETIQKESSDKFTHQKTNMKPLILDKDNVNSVKDTASTSSSFEKIIQPKTNIKPLIVDKNNVNSVKNSANTSSSLLDNLKKPESNGAGLSAIQHSKKRNLINQLEQSIAKGDENAAADAAAKLAQLRLACSVLSFSSQILGEASKTTANLQKVSSRPSIKVDAAVQSAARVTTKSINKELVVPPRSTSIGTHLLSAPSTSECVKNELLSKSTELTTSNLVAPSTSTQVTAADEFVTIEVMVEDREATRGPIRLRIRHQATLGELRHRAEMTLGLASRLQRWIIDRALCTNDTASLVALAGIDFSAPFYLCVVESESKFDKAQSGVNVSATTDQNTDSKTSAVYTELVMLEQRALINNAEPFECGVCIEECAVGGGVVLRECVHTFCRDCLSDLIRHCEEPAVSCPAMGCSGILQEREIRALISPEEYERWLARGLAAAESGTRNAFHCRTRDCTGWALCDPGVQNFPCPVCKKNNCVPCQAIHEGQTCAQHLAGMEAANTAPGSSQDDESTLALLNTLISKGEALECPKCSAIITKKWGCDWVKCSACKTEICWVTRGCRWGPGGRGDTSGGCRCGVGGQRCHPSCGYCH